MNITELKAKIEGLRTYFGIGFIVDSSGQPTEADMLSRDDVLSLLSEVTVEDVMADIKCEDCSFFDKWDEGFGGCDYQDRPIDADFGCKHFKDKK